MGGPVSAATMTEPITVDAAGAAELLGVSERTVRIWTTEGLLPSLDLRDHRTRLYSVEALRLWALERSGYDAATRLPFAHGR